MDFNEAKRIEDLDHAHTVRFVLDLLHRSMFHYVLWFSEVQRQMGFEQALELLTEVYARSYALQVKRLAGVLGFELQDDLPAPLLNMSKQELWQLADGLAVNWLANDGVWFQAVEFAHSLNDAKRCNDACWAHFAPFEAWSIKRLLGLPEMPGLEGLEKALDFRLYTRINTQSCVREGPHSLVFQMNRCRVQAARKRKGLEDYPCKSGGLVEYTSFARAIDPRIRTQCIGCPPDAHPAEWYCAWRFTLDPAEPLPLAAAKG